MDASVPTRWSGSVWRRPCTAGACPASIELADPQADRSAARNVAAWLLAAGNLIRLHTKNVRAIVAGLVQHKAFFEARRDGPGEVGGVNFTFSTFWHSVKNCVIVQGFASKTQNTK